MAASRTPVVSPGYSRAGLRAWLTTLPPDEPFCTDCNCPITEYMVRAVGRRGYDNAASASVDRRLADAIDKLAERKPHFDHRGIADWANLTPREVMAMIDELDAERAGEKQTLADVLAPWL